MIKKYSIMILFLLFILLILTPATAQDSNDTVIGNATNVRTYADLSDIINTGNESVIELNDNYQYHATLDSDFNDGVVISRNVTIHGNTGNVIDGNHQARGIAIESNCSVVLENLRFINCHSNSSGGAVLLKSNSNLTMINCIFENNLVYNSNGGALDAKTGTNIEIDNCIFTNNTSIRESELEWEAFKSGMGSAICVSCNSNVKMSNTEFRKNNAYLSTVLVVSYNELIYEPSTLYVKNCTFENNTSLRSGIIYLDELGSGEILDSIFRANNAIETSGTVILESSIYAIVKNCLFEANNAMRGGGINLKYFNQSSNVEVVGCNFTNNHADVTGGAIYSNHGNLTVMNCNFNNNEALANGGAIYSHEGSIKIISSNFTNNNACYGGAVSFKLENGSVYDCSFTNNTADENGGGIYSNQADSTIVNSSFHNNVALNNGGGVYTTTDRSVHIADSNFTNNKAINGGAISLRSALNKLSNCIITDNNAENNGGGVYSNTPVENQGITFKNNTAAIGPDVYGLFTCQITAASKYYGNVELKIKLSTLWNQSLAQKIKIKFKGKKTYTTKWLKTNSKGELTLKNPLGLNADTYTIEVMLESGFCQWNPEKIKISKSPVKLSVKSLTTTYKSGKVLKFYVTNTKNKKNVAGAKLTLKVYTGKKYKSYTLTSDKNGLVKFSTNNVKTGKHTIKITAKNSNIKLSSVKKTITVKKATVKLSYSKKVKKGSKIKVTVKNKASGNALKKFKFTVKVKGKSFVAKTTSKGVLKIPTKSLSKGWHKITIIHKSTNYNIKKSIKVKVR